MSLARTAVTPSVVTVGGLLPADMLTRIADGKELVGSAPADYRLFGPRDTVRDAAERSWSALRGNWTALRDALEKEGADENGGVQATGITRRFWLLPLLDELKFGHLPAVPAGGLPSADGEKHFPVSHHWEHVPVHLLGWNTPLDVKTEGVARSAPQSMMQEYLNRSGPGTLWGVLTNGRLLRLLRDSSSLVGASYIEFDLQSIFDGDHFSEFQLLWRLLHQSRFDVRTTGAEAADPDEPAAAAPNPANCWLEKWRTEAIASGTRALDQLREGVEKALVTLGTGFIKDPANRALRERLHQQDVTVDLLHRALLRLAYRLLFLFVAEDRDVLIPADADPAARDRYERYFSSAKLRRLANRRRGGPHGDQWQGLRLVLDGLGKEGGLPTLGLPALGGLFEPTEDDTVLDGWELSNQALFSAIRSLSVVDDKKLGRPRPVDYRHLGAEELGSIYESLLELVPRRGDDDSFELRTLAGNERKTTGSYYTPAPLIESLLDSALEPVITDAVKSGTTREEQEAALLSLTVCDPACGSGHFLVAAARRIAKRLAAVREDDPEPPVEAVRHALREVIGRCVYGVDLNHLAVELAKVSLWIEALDPGKPLTFLDAHIRHGNGLLGTTPKLLAGGLPDDAFKAIEGDDKKWVSGLKKRNKGERLAWLDNLRHNALQGELFETVPLRASNADLAQEATGITAADSDSLEKVHRQRDRYHKLTTSRKYVEARKLADAWCAAFVWPKTREAVPAITTKTLLDLSDDGAPVAAGVDKLIEDLRDAYDFFHWHLEFPEVFRVPEGTGSVDERTGWAGGFSCMLGNPPWERVKLQEQEYFASRSKEIAEAANKAARERLITALATSEHAEERALAADFAAAKRIAEGTSHLLRDSARFPLAGAGDVNTYAVFAENASHAIAPLGHFGLVLPTGIATDATTAPFFSDLVRTARLAAFLDFENEAFLLSRDVDHRVRFCLLTVGGRDVRVREASFAFGTRYMEDLTARRFAMPPEEILLVNPNTGTLPVFRSRRDAEITLDIYRRVPVLIKEGDPDGNPWGLSFMTMFHMSNDSHLFRTAEQLEGDGWELRGNVFERGEQRYLPLYEAKMLHHFDHRLGTYEGQTQAQANMGTLPRLTPEQHDDPEFVPMPRYWVPEFDVPTEKRDKKGNSIYEMGVAARLADRNWDKPWLAGFRKICRSTDRRTVLSFLFPAHGLGDSANLMLPTAPGNTAALYANTSALVLDYVLRQKMAGTNLNFFQFEQLAVLTPEAYDQLGPDGTGDLGTWITKRAVELVVTDRSMVPFADEFGHSQVPFHWDEARRALIRAELDAVFFRLYGLDRDELKHVMETFPIVKREDLAAHGTYRTKDLILDVYDRMAEAERSGTPYRTLIDPPPGHGPRHPAKSSAN